MNSTCYVVAKQAEWRIEMNTISGIRSLLFRIVKDTEICSHLVRELHDSAPSILGNISDCNVHSPALPSHCCTIATATALRKCCLTIPRVVFMEISKEGIIVIGHCVRTRETLGTAVVIEII